MVRHGVETWLAALQSCGVKSEHRGTILTNVVYAQDTRATDSKKDTNHNNQTFDFQVALNTI